MSHNLSLFAVNAGVDTLASLGRRLAHATSPTYILYIYIYEVCRCRAYIYG